MNSLIDQAIAAHRSGNFTLAESLYQRILSANSRDFDALHMFGVLCGQREQFEEAERLLRTALSIDTKHPPCYHHYGNVLVKFNRYQEAIDSYNKALALAPDYVPIYLDRGNALQKLGRLEQALVSYDKALALKPDLAVAWLGRGNVLFELKRYDDALAAFDKALVLNPDLGAAWLARGNIFFELKRYDDAFAAYDKALTLKPDLAEAWLNRGNVFFELKRYDDAFAAYDKALAFKPDLAEAWLGRGSSQCLRGRVKEGIEDYKQALKRGADQEVVKYELAKFQAEETPLTVPASMIVRLFDRYATHFDEHLVGKLKYQIPTLLCDLIKSTQYTKPLDILDLGCGTGLMAAELRPLANTLNGVDLSSKMLERAQQRKLYDHLICSEITEFLSKQHQAYDLVVAADVLVYFGDLSLVFQLVRQVLRNNGLFSFSVEATYENDFVLKNTGRYAHSYDYLRRLAKAYCFVAETIELSVVRQEHEHDVDGYIALMRCL